MRKSEITTQPAEPLPLLDAPFAALASGHVGQVIVDANGATVCWTCDGALAGVLAGLLNHVGGVGVVPSSPEKRRPLTT
jgi:hypothetical protein